MRKVWTLLDRNYSQCRRAIAFLHWSEGDVDIIAPNLRRNAGRRPQPEQPEQPEQDPAAAAATPSDAGAVIGDDDDPFIKT